MSESTTVVSLPNMVDLALNSPEVGIVNFTVLHSLLHVLVHQLNLSDINVEFRGTDSERLQSYIKTAKPGPLLTLTEYVVGPDSVDGGKVREEKKKSKAGTADEKGKRDEAQKEKQEVHVVETGEDNKSTVVLVKSSKGSVENPQFTVVVTKNHFDKLEDDIKKLDERIKELAELPANSALIQAIRTEDTQKTPVLDIYQILNLTKRLDAAEVTMGKLASMMEDIAKKAPLGAVDTASGGMGTVGGVDGTEEGFDLNTVEGRLQRLEQAILAVDEDNREGTIASKPSEPSNIETTDLGKIPPQKAVQTLQQQLLTMKNNVDMFSEALKDLEEIKKMLSPGDDTNLPPEARLKNLENKYNDCVEQLNSLDNMFSRQMNTLTKRIGDLEKHFGEIMEKVNLGVIAGEDDKIIEGQSLPDIYNKLAQLQEEMTAMTEAAEKLMDDRNERQHALDVLTEQVELLKTVKADKEELEDALADKADACMVNRKVSVEQFDATCGDMTRAIEDALAKLEEQHTLWTQALDEIQLNVGNKLDKAELAPMRDFINNKLKHLQDRLKSLASLKKDNEAAGTKSKFLRNVNCISCDKDVVMRKQVDSSLYPKPPALPPTRNMAPYLAYELDQLRKQEKCVPNSRNLNAFENAVHSAKTARGPDNLCNRYCGGSHTLTTPQQRVTRLGHFLEQWGPEIAPVNDQNIRGTDGKMYKGRDDRGLRDSSAPPIPPTPTAPEGSFVFPTLGQGEATTVKAESKPRVSGGTIGSKGEPRRSGAESTSTPKPATDVTGEAAPKSEVSGQLRKTSGQSGGQGEVMKKASGTDSIKKSASRSSAKGSKASLEKVPSGAKPSEGSAEKVIREETVEEVPAPIEAGGEAEAPPA